MKAFGRKTWLISGGRIPSASTGREPAFTSRDQLSILNTSDRDADIEITIFYADAEPVGPYCVTVPARRVLKVRFNDLIDPEALFLDRDYSAVIHSNVKVVIQFSRLDSGAASNAITGTMAYSQN
jgi:hypothetical protein